jgi:hypothetical protein
LSKAAALRLSAAALLLLAGAWLGWCATTIRSEGSASFTDIQVRTIDEAWVHRGWIGTYHTGSCCIRTWTFRQTRRGAELNLVPMTSFDPLMLPGLDRLGTTAYREALFDIPPDVRSVTFGTDRRLIWSRGRDAAQRNL